MSIVRVQDWLRGYRTVIINVVSLLTMVAGSFIPVEGAAPTGDDVVTVIDQGVAFSVGVVNVINIVLRWLTKTPIFVA